jgi:uncharacterized protein
VVLLAFFNPLEPAHIAVRSAVEHEPDPLVVSPFVIAELDYLVATRLGLDAERRVLAELATGAYDLAQIDRDDIAACERVIAKHADQQIGVTDASLVVLAARVGTKQILTLDRRHFGVMRPLQGGRFVVVGATT